LGRVSQKQPEIPKRPFQAAPSRKQHPGSLKTTRSPFQAAPNRHPKRKPDMHTDGKLLLSIRNLTKRYGDQTILESLNLDLHKGEVVVILGPSGSGKSTLLRCVNGLEEKQGGSIVMDGAGEFGKDLPWEAARQKVGMVFQSYELFAHMNVIDNILLGPLKAQGRSRAEAEAQADKLLKRVGLYERKTAYPRELSGGQKQRIAIVRALCMNPEAILLDEITAALDPEMVREVLDVVLELAREGMSMLIVTHEMGFAEKVADRIVFMDNGCIIEETTPDIFFHRPESPRAQQFLQGMDYSI